MITLERAYSLVRNGSSLLNESSPGGPQPVNDQEIANAHVVPDQLRQFFLPGSGKMQTNSNGETGWGAEYLLALPKSKWTDGTEDLTATYDYVEQKIKEELPQSGADPSGSFVHSYAIVQDDKSTDDTIIVRCVLRGGLDM